MKDTEFVFYCYFFLYFFILPVNKHAINMIYLTIRCSEKDVERAKYSKLIICSLMKSKRKLTVSRESIE